jgi:alkylation response protein AidB-like acyl-CoA dehydrogenase
MLTQQRRGGSFLFESVQASDVLTPERLRSEQRLVAQAAGEFVAREVRPRLDDLERHDWDLARKLLHQAGELGLLGIELPAELGGAGLDKVSAALVAEELGAAGSFSITFAVQTGIGMLPIAYFGTPEQKRKYLPALISGEKVGAYSLTEPGSGSDALGARTTARLSPDGTHYLLNGVKQWTSNAGFADLFVVFAKIDGQQFSAFLVERGFPGVSIGQEEQKMGLKGSSTAQVILNDAQVPVENLLHFAGRGHQVAFNQLNLGRFGLAMVSLGSCRHLLGVTVRYAQERQQFGRPLASFRLIQQKLAGMAARTYALESTAYRIAGLLDASSRDLDVLGDAREEAARVLAEYAIECSIAKVLGTEILRDVVDEGVQIHGGYGFMHGYDVERTYRDCRIFRIFEGTNEINRLLILETLLRRARRGEAPEVEAKLRQAATAVRNAAPPAFASPLDREAYVLETTRALFWLVVGLATQRFPQGLEEEQEVLALAGDLAIETLALESILARARQAAETGDAATASLHADLARAYADPAFRRVADWARTAVTYLTSGDEQRTLLAALDKLSPTEPVNQVSIGRRIAEKVIAAEGWPLRQ